MHVLKIRIYKFVQHASIQPQALIAKFPVVQDLVNILTEVLFLALAELHWIV